MSDLERDVQEAIDALIKADPRNSQKGRLLKDFFAYRYSLPNCGVSYVTEKKQIYNRVPEQYKHNAPLVVFVAKSPEFVDELVNQALRLAYQELAIVLIYVASDTQSVRLDTAILFKSKSADQDGAKELIDALRQGKYRIIERGEPPQIILTDPKWPKTTANSDPCGLVGLGQIFAEAAAALETGHHLILVGPPGTGKSELAVCICETLEIEYDFVTATADWTNFDTVGGYFPDPENGGTLVFNEGLLTTALSNNHWLVIDELNRADIDKAFGEFFTILTGQPVITPYKRRVDGELKSVMLGGLEPSEDEHISSIVLPAAWRLIGTMNTFDKASLFRLSYAFMRRFAFVYVPIVDETQYRRALQTKAHAHAQKGKWIEIVADLFGGDGPMSLRQIGATVGPAIGIDVLNHVLHVIDREPTSDPLLQALRLYYFPQLEGRSDIHQQITDAVRKAVGLEVSSDVVSAALAVWTGFTEDVN